MCSVWCLTKKLSCAQPLEWPFELGFTEQILKILEDNSEHFRAFWKTPFERERAKESPEIYFRAKSFRTIFEKRAPVYSLEALLLGMAKSILETIEHYNSGNISSLEAGSNTQARDEISWDQHWGYVITNRFRNWWISSCTHWTKTHHFNGNTSLRL